MKATIYYIRTQKTVVKENVTAINFSKSDLILDFADGSWQVFPKDMEVSIDIKQN